MFLNCCRRCSCRQNSNQENHCHNKCDRYDNKCDKHDRCDNFDNKCDWERKEKCHCHITYEKKCGCDNNYGQNFDNSTQNNNYCAQYNNFDGQSYFCEYNNLGSFNNQHNCSCQNNNNNNQKADTCFDHFDKNCYTPNWDNDKDCPCENHKSNKHNKDNSKYCKPVKYICIPFDNY